MRSHDIQRCAGLFLFFAGFACLSGCVTGRKFDMSLGAQIINGKTTREDVIELLGEPYKLWQGPGDIEKLLYFYKKTAVHDESIVEQHGGTKVIKPHFGVTTVSRNLVVTLKNGVVSNAGIVDGTIAGQPGFTGSRLFIGPRWYEVQGTERSARRSSCPPAGAEVPFHKLVTAAFQHEFNGCQIKTTAKVVTRMGESSQGKALALDGQIPSVDDMLALIAIPPGAQGAENLEVLVPKEASDLYFNLKPGDRIRLTGEFREGAIVSVMRVATFLADKLERSK